MKYRGCLGRKMYSDSTLKSCTKDELIEFLHVAERNYRNLEDTYERSVSNANRILGDYDKVFKKAASLLDEVSRNGDLMCPMEWLGRCACITTENGFECPDDTADWKFALKESLKERMEKPNE